jgi:hypothetical protein
MLGNYLTFDGKQFPNPQPPTMDIATVENVTTSEAGNDLVVVIRPAKRSWSFTFNLSPLKKEVLKALCQKESVQMTYMGAPYRVRIRDYSEQLVEGSEWLRNVDGLYTCTVKVMEF